MPARKCPVCGADLPEAGMEGLCPLCVVRQVLADGLGSVASDSPANDGTSGGPAPEPPGQPAPEHAVALPPRVLEPETPSVPADSPVVHSVGDWTPGQELLDDFVVEQTLGEGGMGKVYLVRSRSTGSQFAVKRAKGLKASDRRKFLAELQTWIDLPDHANLVPCRFFRTVGDEVVIFAEYVEGGSLKEWIDTKKLYEGGSRQALERMLDVAIQFAWGLHCVHQLRLVHQDVKPGNVMMGRDQKVAVQDVKPRLTDYGLARARAAAGERHVPDAGRSLLVSNGGGTPAFWSPEQAQGLPLTFETDIWSWGLSVLEMFTGQLRWNSGDQAPEHLEQYLQRSAHDKAITRQPARVAAWLRKCFRRNPAEQFEAIPGMPASMAALLRECFRPNPAERLPSLAEAVHRLKAIYRKFLGTAYSRSLEEIERADPSQAGVNERRGDPNVSWSDPQMWLEAALRAAGRDPAEAGAIVSRRGMTRRGELVAELTVYGEAKRLYEQLVRDGRKELERDLARLCMEKGLVHATAADFTGRIRNTIRRLRFGSGWSTRKAAANWRMPWRERT